jgi:hypothetical protein
MYNEVGDPEFVPRAVVEFFIDIVLRRKPHFAELFVGSIPLGVR